MSGFARREGSTSGRSGHFWRESGNFWGRSGKLPGNLWIALTIHSERSSREVAREFLGKFRETLRSAGNFQKLWGSPTSLPLSGPVLRDTARLSQRYPPIARYGVLGVSTWPLGCDTTSAFSEHFPLGKHAKWGCDTPPQKGYLSDTCAMPYENMAKRVRYPPLRYYLERVLRDMGGYLALGR